MNMEGFGDIKIKSEPSDGSEGENLLSTHIKQIERGQNGVVNEYRVRGMFNGEGEMFSTIATKKVADDLTMEALSNRDK